MTWDPQQYHRFQSERFAPFHDAVALVVRREGMRVVDLGCGTGELTSRLADALPGSVVVGIDSSASMLAKAEAQARPGLRFEQADLRDLQGHWDLIFSHAVIQWVEDHEQLIPQLVAHLEPGGQLVVQLPSNHTHPSQTEIVATAQEEPFVQALGGWYRQSPVLSVARYAELLFACGLENLTVFEKVYPHVLADADAMVEWTRGTALLPYMERLPSDLHAAFLDRYRQRLREHFPARPAFFGFRRIIFAGTKAVQE
jgi:trans-aconitate 2-methyltransferase